MSALPSLQSSSWRAASGRQAPAADRTGETMQAVVAVLETLDRLLGLAVDKVARLLGPATLLDPWRGMHLDADEVRRALGRDRETSIAAADAVSALSDALLRSDATRRLCRIAHLEALDLAIVAIAIAPDIDLRYERIYAYLQDDISRKRPTPDLIANLLCVSPAERIHLMTRLDSHAPLHRHGVLQWCGSSDNSDLARPLRIARLWLDALTGRGVASTPTPELAATAAIEPGMVARMQLLVQATVDSQQPIRIILQGPHGAGKHVLALHIAHIAGLSSLTVDVRDCASAADVQSTLHSAVTAASVRCALPFIHGASRLQTRDPQLLRALQTELANESIGFVLALSAPLPFAHGAAILAARVDLDLPSVATRQQAWTAALKRYGVTASSKDVEAVAARFILSGAQIAQAIADVAHRLRSTSSAAACGADMAAAARALCGDELARLAQRVRPQVGFESLVAAVEVDAQLRELCARVTLRERVRDRWIGGSVHGRVVGVNALFAGPSGTGKTLAAEIVAYELGLDLFRIDLSAVVSKYIGETEKNLDRVFTAAANANAVLFFDEADALFGKRSEVKDAHDRYANIEIAYLLQKIEQFDGVAILATNLKQNIDEAFTRRLTFCINFAFPEEAERVRLWQTLWPRATPRADDVDFAALAREYRLSGGNIRNIVIASAYLAAADGDTVTRAHVLHAIRREFQKIGKTLAPAMASIDKRAA